MTGTQPSPALPVGGPTLMPLASQGAEQWSGRRARRTGFRWGLRTLVVGGLAGAAWLLGGAVAHAADTATGPVPGGLSVLPAVHHLSQDEAALVLRVDRLAGGHERAQRQSGRPAGRVVARPGAMPQLSTVAEPAHRLVDAVVAADDDSAAVPSEIVEGLTAALRLTDGPVSPSVTTPTTQLVTSTVLRPVIGVLPHRAAPAPAPRGATTVGSRTPLRIPDTSAADHVVASPPPALPGGEAVDGAAAAGSFAGGSRLGSDRKARWFVAAHRPSTATTVGPVGVQGVPGSGHVALPQVRFGTGSGSLTFGSGSLVDGGCAVTLPAVVVAGMVVYRQPVIVTDVEVRCYDTVPPTVSPD